MLSLFRYQDYVTELAVVNICSVCVGYPIRQKDRNEIENTNRKNSNRLCEEEKNVSGSPICSTYSGRKRRAASMSYEVIDSSIDTCEVGSVVVV